MDANELEFQSIYTAFQPKILRYLTRLVGEQDAEDLTQEVFIKANQALPGFRGESSLSTWLYRIATNAATDRLRSPSFRHGAQNWQPQDASEAVLEEIEDQDLWTGAKTPAVEQQCVRSEMSDCILGYIKNLPENYRTVLVLSDVEELSNKEIAEILGTTLDTVKIRLHRARARLREAFETHCEYYWVNELSWLPA